MWILQNKSQRLVLVRNKITHKSYFYLLRIGYFQEVCLNFSFSTVLAVADYIRDRRYCIFHCALYSQLHGFIV